MIFPRCNAIHTMWMSIPIDVVFLDADAEVAAGEQLTEWANRAGVEIIGGSEGADPASVVFDAVSAAKARKADVLLIDTLPYNQSFVSMEVLVL